MRGIVVTNKKKYKGIGVAIFSPDTEKVTKSDSVEVPELWLESARILNDVADFLAKTEGKGGETKAFRMMFLNDLRELIKGRY